MAVSRFTSRQPAEPNIIERVAEAIWQVSAREVKMEETAMLAAARLRGAGFLSSRENLAPNHEADALLLRNRQNIIDLGMGAAANILDMLEQSDEEAAREAIRIMRVLDKKCDAELGWHHFGEIEVGEGKLLEAMGLARRHDGVSRGGKCSYGLTWWGHQIVELLEKRESGEAAMAPE